MATVPSYSNLQTSVAQRPNAQFQGPSGPQAGAIAAEQTAQMGQATTRLGGEVGRIALDMQQQANQVRVTDAMNKVMAERLRLTYDQQTGFMTKRGQAALDPDADGKPLEQSYGEAFQKKIQELGDQLGNENQRQLFNQQAGQVHQQFAGAIAQHVGREFADYSVSVQQGTAKLAQEQMGVAWGDAQAVEQSRNAIKAATAEEGRLRGWSAAQTEAAMQEQLTRGHASVVMAALQAGKPEYAAEYMKQMDKEIVGPARLQLVANVTAQDTLVRGEAAAAQAWAENKPATINDAVRAYDMEQSIRDKYADQPHIQKAALAGLKDRIQSFNAQQAESNANSTNKVYGMIDGGMPLSKVKASPVWLALPETKRHEITKGLEAEAATRAARGASDAQRSLAEMQRNDKLALLRNAGDYLSDSNPDVLASMTRAQVEATRTKYGFEGAQQLTAKWESLQNKAERTVAKIDHDAFKSVVKETLDLDPYGKNDSETKAMLGDLKSRVDTMLTAKAQELRRPLTPDEKSEFMRAETAKTVTVDGWIWGTEKSAAKLTPKEAARVVVPEDRKAQIVESMRKAYQATNDPDYAPTPENMARIYLKSVSPLAGLPNAPK